MKKIETFIGDSFDKVSERSKQLATKENIRVKFDFNGTVCIVDKDTDIILLYRDYVNSHIMNWETIGPNCLPAYESDVQTELDKRKKVQEDEENIRRAEYKKEEDRERNIFNNKILGVKFECSDLGYFEKQKALNSDSYGAAIIDYAESWAKLMQVEISNGKKLIECAESTSFELGFLGITGFMYGAAVSILSQCWKHGEELRKWHNKEYNNEDAIGVINPAVLTIGSK